MDTWRILNVNPEPWAVPIFTPGRNPHSKKLYVKPGKNAALDAFQKEVQEALNDEVNPIEGEVVLTFFFWRNLEERVSDSGRVTHANQADATNMQKALEDSLQDVLFGNDKNVRDIRSVIVEQGADVTPRIVLHVKEWEDFNPDEIPADVWAEIDKAPTIFDLARSEDANSWPPRP